jgi:hypothetical protein
MNCGLNSFVSGWGTMGALCEYGNECLGSFKSENFLTILPDYLLLKKSVPTESYCNLYSLIFVLFQ